MKSRDTDVAYVKERMLKYEIENRKSENKYPLIFRILLFTLYFRFHISDLFNEREIPISPGNPRFSAWSRQNAAGFSKWMLLYQLGHTIVERATGFEPATLSLVPLKCSGILKMAAAHFVRRPFWKKLMLYQLRYSIVERATGFEPATLSLGS